MAAQPQPQTIGVTVLVLKPAVPIGVSTPAAPGVWRWRHPPREARPRRAAPGRAAGSERPGQAPASSATAAGAEGSAAGREGRGGRRNGARTGAASRGVVLCGGSGGGRDAKARGPQPRTRAPRYLGVHVPSRAAAAPDPWLVSLGWPPRSQSALRCRWRAPQGEPAGCFHLSEAHRPDHGASPPPSSSAASLPLHAAEGPLGRIVPIRPPRDRPAQALHLPHAPYRVHRRHRFSPAYRCTGPDPGGGWWRS